MKNECGIIRDLLPLYAENIASDESVEFVEEHIKTCEECREELERIKEPKPLDTNALQEETTAVPLIKLRRKMRIKRLQTVAATAFLVIALLVSTFAALNAPIYFPYSKDIVTVTENNDDTVTFTFDEKVTHYTSDSYHDSYVEGLDRYEIIAWTSLWDKWFSIKERPLWFTEGYKSPVYYISNNGAEDVCIYGEPLDPSISSISLPRLALAYYVIIAAILFAVLLLARIIFRKKESVKIWIERIMLYPLSYGIAHLLVLGFSFVTYSITRDLTLIISISLLLWCALLIAHGIFKNRREIREMSKALEE